MPTPPSTQGLYSEMKFERPSQIQATTLPMALTPHNGQYKDLVAQAQNGCGKTVCFALVMLTRCVYPAAMHACLMALLSNPGDRHRVLCDVQLRYYQPMAATAC